MAPRFAAGSFATLLPPSFRFFNIFDKEKSKFFLKKIVKKIDNFVFFLYHSVN